METKKQNKEIPNVAVHRFSQGIGINYCVKYEQGDKSKLMYCNYCERIAPRTYRLSEDDNVMCEVRGMRTADQALYHLATEKARRISEKLNCKLEDRSDETSFMGTGSLGGV
jgi:hypothetical protein